MNIGMDAQCPHNCRCLCCQEARKVEPYCEDCRQDECVCPGYDPDAPVTIVPKLKSPFRTKKGEPRE